MGEEEGRQDGERRTYKEAAGARAYGSTTDNDVTSAMNEDGVKRTVFSSISATRV